MTKEFSRKVISKFTCRVIWEQNEINRMCAHPAQRDLGKIGKRSALKRHKTSCKLLNVKYLGKQFKRHSVLKHHIEIHKNEQRYNCSFCPLRFNTTAYVRYHDRKQQKSESIPPLDNSPIANLASYALSA